MQMVQTVTIAKEYPIKGIYSTVEVYITGTGCYHDVPFHPQWMTGSVHPCHCGGWVKGVPTQTEPQQLLHPSEGAPQGQVGTGKGDDPQSNLGFLPHLVPSPLATL